MRVRLCRRERRIEKGELLPPDLFAAWSAAETQAILAAPGQSPPVVRSPNEIYADDRDCWTAGNGEWDGVTPPTRAQAVFSKLSHAPERRLVQIGETTHIALLEKHRLQIYREVQMFLDE